jgi:hypothetical protein
MQSIVPVGTDVRKDTDPTVSAIGRDDTFPARLPARPAC